MTPITNKFFKKEEHRGQKKTIKLELSTFSRVILFGFSTTFGILGKNVFYTVKVNKSLTMFEIVEC